MLPQGTWFCSAENTDRKLFRSADLPAAALHFPRSTLHKTRTLAPHFFIISTLKFFIKRKPDTNPRF